MSPSAPTAYAPRIGERHAESFSQYEEGCSLCPHSPHFYHLLFGEFRDSVAGASTRQTGCYGMVDVPLSRYVLKILNSVIGLVPVFVIDLVSEWSWSKESGGDNLMGTATEASWTCFQGKAKIPLRFSVC